MEIDVAGIMFCHGNCTHPTKTNSVVFVRYISYDTGCQRKCRVHRAAISQIRLVIGQGDIGRICQRLDRSDSPLQANRNSLARQPQWQGLEFDKI
jgi:hypothetical protein